jgi:hypothetical protein
MTKGEVRELVDLQRNVPINGTNTRSDVPADQSCLGRRKNEHLPFKIPSFIVLSALYSSSTDVPRCPMGSLAQSAKLCRMIEAATVTLSEAVPPPYCGMYTKSSQMATCAEFIPLPCKCNVQKNIALLVSLQWLAEYYIARH